MLQRTQVLKNVLYLEFQKTGLQSWFQNSLSLNFPESGFSSEKYSDYWFDLGQTLQQFYERLYVKCLIKYKLYRNI